MNCYTPWLTLVICLQRARWLVSPHQSFESTAHLQPRRAAPAVVLLEGNSRAPCMCVEEQAYI